ncbi:MAG TPA: hypothetical protein VKR58_15350 [Aquella sp.]|nr:hypothetical protein [Aquella sp.]
MVIGNRVSIHEDYSGWEWEGTIVQVCDNTYGIVDSAGLAFFVPHNLVSIIGENIICII